MGNMTCPNVIQLRVSEAPEGTYLYKPGSAVGVLVTGRPGNPPVVYASTEPTTKCGCIDENQMSGPTHICLTGLDSEAPSDKV